MLVRIRRVSVLCLALAVSLLAVSAAPGQAPAKHEPALLLRTKPIVDVLAAVKTAAKRMLAASPDQLAAFEAQWGAAVGERGENLPGIDASRPLAVYACADDSLVMVGAVVPVKDEKEFRSTLEMLGVTSKPVEDHFDLTAPGLTQPTKLKFADKYAYLAFGVTVVTSGPAPIPVAQLLPAGQPSPTAIWLDARPGRVAAVFRNLFLAGAKQAVSSNPERQPGETAAAFAGRQWGVQFAWSAFTQLSEEVEALNVTLDLPTAENLVLDFKVQPKSNAPLAKSLSAGTSSRSQFAVPELPGSQLGYVRMHGPLCATLKEFLGLALGEGIKAATGSDEPEQQDLRLYRLLAAHFGPAPLDVAFDASATTAPANATYLLRAAIVDGAKLEAGLRELLPDAPADLKQALKLDALKSGGVNIHAVEFPAELRQNGPQGARRFFSEKIYFAITPGAVLAVAGSGGEAVLTKALAAPKPAKDPLAGAVRGPQDLPLSYVVNVRNVFAFTMGLDDHSPKTNAKFAELMKQLAGQNDKIALTMDGGTNLQFKLDLGTSAIATSMGVVAIQVQEVFERVSEDLPAKKE